MLPVDVVKKVIESIETGDMETTGIYISESLVCSGLLPEVLAKRQFLEVMTSVLDAVPNLLFNTKDIQEKGINVRVKARLSGSNSGAVNFPLLDIARVRPTGKRFMLPEERVDFAVRDNKILSIRFEQMPGGLIQVLLKQLGVELPEKVAV